METILFEIHYRLTLADETFLETRTLVAAKDRHQAASKLETWRKTKHPGFTKIEYFAIEEVNQVII